MFVPVALGLCLCLLKYQTGIIKLRSLDLNVSISCLYLILCFIPAVQRFQILLIRDKKVPRALNPTCMAFCLRTDNKGSIILL